MRSDFLFYFIRLVTEGKCFSASIFFWNVTITFEMSYETTFFALSVVWMFLGMGDQEREHPCSQWQQIHWDECLQRWHHVHHRCCGVFSDEGPAQCPVLHCSTGDHLLQHHHALSGLCSQGQFLCNRAQVDNSSLPKTRVLNYHHIHTSYFSKPWKLKLQHEQFCVEFFQPV